MRIDLTVNGTARTCEVEPWTSLLTLLREGLDLRGAKNACEQGECGSCSVLVDDELVCSCLVMACQVQGGSVTTPEGLTGHVAELVRSALDDAGAVQCGFCTPGFAVSMTSLVQDEPDADEQRVREYLSGNLCRCTGYARIVAAARSAQEQAR